MKYWALFIIVFIHCSCDEKKPLVPQLEVQEVKKDLIVRFDQLIANLDKEALEKQCEKSPKFCELYFSNVMAISEKIFSPNFYNQLDQYRQDTFIISMHEKINQKYTNLDRLNLDLSKIIGRLKTLIPGYQFDQVYTFTSGFSYQAFLFSEGEKDALGIGLDMFLTPEINYKQLDPKNPVFADYLTQTYTEDYIATKASSIIADDLIKPLGNQQRMIDYMIRSGKKLYVAEQLLPEKEKHLIVDYSVTQYEWCANNEKDTWGFFLEKELLYETDMRKINKYINPSPDAPGMPKNAPGQTANFVGWQIVKSFMKRNQNVGIVDLINMTDAQDILQKSKYKPRN